MKQDESKAVITIESEIYRQRENLKKRLNINLKEQDKNMIKSRCLAAISKVLNNANRPSAFDINLDSDDFLDDYSYEVSMIMGIDCETNSFNQFEFKELYKF